jgi:hypothetical protein
MNINEYLLVEEYFHKRRQSFDYLMDEYQYHVMFHWSTEELEMMLNQIIYKEHFVLFHLIQEKVIDHPLTM